MNKIQIDGYTRISGLDDHKQKASATAYTTPCANRQGGKRAYHSRYTMPAIRCYSYPYKSKL